MSEFFILHTNIAVFDNTLALCERYVTCSTWSWSKLQFFCTLFSSKLCWFAVFSTLFSTHGACRMCFQIWTAISLFIKAYKYRTQKQTFWLMVCNIVAHTFRNRFSELKSKQHDPACSIAIFFCLIFPPDHMFSWAIFNREHVSVLCEAPEGYNKLAALWPPVRMRTFHLWTTCPSKLSSVT